MIELYTSPTPNGYKISILLEELAVPYKVHHIKLSEGEQKEAWFLKINPNGRIPAIIDKDENDFAVFESGAILIYLAEKYQRFLATDSKRRSETLQWLMFQMAGIGPMQGQANVFFRYAPEVIPYAIVRYQNETKRLYSVLNSRLIDHEYLVDDYSIADIATFPWVNAHEWAGVSIEEFEHLSRWLANMGERPAVQKGLMIPESSTTQGELSDEMKEKRVGSKILEPVNLSKNKT